MSPSALIVGCGRIAGGFNEADESAVLTHVAAYRRLGVPVAACCDRDPEQAARFARRWGIPLQGTALGELLAAARPSVVSLCTPPSETSRLLDSVLEAESVGSVLVEKPLGASAREARGCAELALQRARPVLVDYFRAFDPYHARLETAVKSGGLGALQSGTARYYGPADANASHWLERVLALFGSPRSVERLGGAPGTPQFQVHFDQGSVLFLPSPGCRYSPFELDLLFEARRVRVIDSERRVEHSGARPDPQFPGYLSLAPEDPWPGLAPSAESLLFVVQAALDAASGKPVAWRELLERAVAVSEILERIA